MRKILSITILITSLLYGHLITAQGMPVYDNTNFLSLAKSLIESAKQTGELLKTVKFLEEQKDNIMKVNTALGELKAMRELTRNHQILYRTVQGDLRDILNSPYIRPEEIRQVSTSFELIMATALDDFDFINAILTNDLLKMTDAERTTILTEKEEQSKNMVAEITKKTERYEDIISFRRMQDRINNREAKY